MKILIALSISLALLSIGCAIQKKVEPGFPEAMLPHVKAENAKRFESGHVLYNLSCARCHNTKVGRKTVIPDFNPEQLSGYSLRVSNAQHEANMPDTLVTQDELGIIMTFLTYKKKNK